MRVQHHRQVFCVMNRSIRLLQAYGSSKTLMLILDLTSCPDTGVLRHDAIVCILLGSRLLGLTWVQCSLKLQGKAGLVLFSGTVTRVAAPCSWLLGVKAVSALAFQLLNGWSLLLIQAPGSCSWPLACSLALAPNPWIISWLWFLPLGSSFGYCLWLQLAFLAPSPDPWPLGVFQYFSAYPSSRFWSE